MNKYQEKALQLLKIDMNDLGVVISEKDPNQKTKHLQIDDDSITIVGDRDIYSKDYTLCLFVGRFVRTELLIGNKWIKQEYGEYTCKIFERKDSFNTKNFTGVQVRLNLDNRPEKIKFIIPGEVTDDIVLDIKYDLMSEEEYWQVQNSPETLRKNMEVTYRTGEDLVNIYWKHAKENIVALVRIDLYMGDTNNPQLMGKYKENDEVFFKSIGGLAYGNYCFKLYQFDKDNKEIASTDFITFSINKPSNNTNNGNTSSGFGGRHDRWRNTVVIGG